MSERTPTVVFSGAPSDAALARSFLQERGIHAELADDRSGPISSRMVEGSGEAAAKVVVATEDAERARDLLEKWERSPEDESEW